MKHSEKKTSKTYAKDPAMITCIYCHATTHQIKMGKTKTGSQIYGCQHCNRKYSPGANHLPRSQSESMLAADTNVAVAIPPGEVPFINHEDMQRSTPAPVSGKAKSARLVVLPSLSERKRRFASQAAGASTTSNQWGWLAELALLESFGLLLLAWAFVGTRATNESAQLLWWTGLAMMILPVAFRLAFAEVSRRERVALLLLLGMSLYLTKVMHSPTAFTFPDELSHLRNVREVVESHRLFQENPVQPVTAFYPGLPIVTSTLSSLSGLSVFTSGLLVIGAARLILFLSLYLLFEQVSGSGRVASLATVFYMANPNFLYWTAEYAYEPLALPLLVFVLFMVAKREMSNDHAQGAWTVPAVFGVLTVVITHHMSSYILTGLLVAISALFFISSRGKQLGPWRLALAAVFATSIWLFFAANLTINYLSPVLSGAVQSVFQMIAEEETSRELFTSSKAGSTEASSTPLWEQILAMGSVILIALGLPLGVFDIWKRHRTQMLAVLLGMIALAYLPVQMLRFTSAGWETANRSSEFLFIGIGFVLALGIVRFWLTHWTGWISKALLAGLSVTLFFGGLIAGWPPRARLARPYVVETGSHFVRPQVITVAEWMLAYLGPDNRIAASKADAKVMGAYGQYPFTDNGPIKAMFLSENFGRSERKTLLKRYIQYVVSDRKIVSWDHMIGYYFYNSQSSRYSDLRLVAPGIFNKFEAADGVNRMLDSGDIVIYDVEMHLAAHEHEMDASQLKSTGAALAATLPKGSMTLGFPSDRNQDSSECMWSVVPTGDWPHPGTEVQDTSVHGARHFQCIDRSTP